MSLQITLDFLTELSSNNNKPWFDAHRAHYDAARSAFEDAVAAILSQFDVVDELPAIDPKETIHRINRDVRFSNDKSPYNAAMSAVIGAEGKKSTGRVYYLRIEPGDRSVAASGVHDLTADELQKLRETIAEDARPLRTILTAPSFQQMFGSMAGEQLKTAPKGFAKDHPAIDLLRYKQFIAERPFADAQVAQPDFPDQAIAVFQAAKPLTLYLHDLLGVRVRPDMHRHAKEE